MSISIPFDSLMKFRAFLMTVKVFSPRKSNFVKPTAWMSFMEYWETTSSLGEQRGTLSTRGTSDITTPAAWVEA